MPSPSDEDAPVANERPEHAARPGTNPANPHRVPLHEHLGIWPREVGAGRSRVELPIASHHLRSRGIAHGGVFAALLDAAQGMAAASVAPDGHDVVTIQLNVNFIRQAGAGETLVALGEVVHHGRRTAVTRAEVRTDSGALAAVGSATLMYLPVAHGPERGGIGPVRERPDGGGDRG
jgi:uncharacterized protein (TIGR00369 family)